MRPTPGDDPALACAGVGDTSRLFDPHLGAGDRVLASGEVFPDPLLNPAPLGDSRVVVPTAFSEDPVDGGLVVGAFSMPRWLKDTVFRDCLAIACSVVLLGHLVARPGSLRRSGQAPPEVRISNTRSQDLIFRVQRSVPCLEQSDVTDGRSNPYVARGEADGPGFPLAGPPDLSLHGVSHPPRHAETTPPGAQRPVRVPDGRWLPPPLDRPPGASPSPTSRRPSSATPPNTTSSSTGSSSTTPLAGPAQSGAPRPSRRLPGRRNRGTRGEPPGNHGGSLAGIPGITGCRFGRSSPPVHNGVRTHRLPDPRSRPNEKRTEPPRASGAQSSLEGGSGGRIRTCDLRVMSPTSCQTAPPRDSGRHYGLPVSGINPFSHSALRIPAREAGPVPGPFPRTRAAR